jgi:hypothetical protein
VGVTFVGGRRRRTGVFLVGARERITVSRGPAPSRRVGAERRQVGMTALARRIGDHVAG